MPITRIIPILLLSAFMTACVTVQPVSNQQSNYAYHYNPSQNTIRPQFLIVNESETTARLYLKINTKELRYSKANSDGEYRAELRYSYLIVPSFEDRTVIDSSSNSINVRYIQGSNRLVTYFDIHPDYLKEYIVYIKLTDELSGQQSKHFLRGLNIKTDNRCSYLIKDTQGQPHFDPYIKKGDTIAIQKLTDIPTRIFVKYYSNEFPPAYAPFNTEVEPVNDPLPEKIYSIPVSHYNARFIPEKKGLYLFTTDTSDSGGYLLFAGDRDYPEFIKSEQLIAPLQYITKKEEYDSIRLADNKKLEIDKFWLKAAGNKDKARQLIRVWYTRAKYANHYFTSYKEGWKTDRGMVFMLFGPPDILNYDDKGERWTYRSKSNQLREFVFVKKNAYTSRTDYSLKRSLSYANVWYLAADSWRNGMIYE